MVDFAPQYWDGDEGRARSYQEQLDHEMGRERARREARRRLDADERGPVLVPDFETLASRLARPRQPVKFRIEGWWPTGARVMLAAQYKSGKTSLVVNSVRSLVDTEPYLDRYAVQPIDGTVAVIDAEMNEAQFDAWMADAGIRRQHLVYPVLLRGRASCFDILRPDVRAQWAARLRLYQTQVLIVDPIRPLLDAIGLDEHKDAGRFLVAFDALIREAGIGEALIVHHMGHNGERARGDSRLRDWPDVEWRLVRETDDPASARFLTAFGRDVEQPEQRLEFDRLTRRLSVAGGSRRDVKQEAALDAVLTVLSSNPQPLSGRAIKTALVDSEHPRDTIDAALRLGIRTLALRAQPGPRASRLYSAVSSVRPLIGGSDTRTLSGELSAGHSPDTHGHSGQSKVEVSAESF